MPYDPSPKIPILMVHALWPAEDDPARLEAIWQADPQLHDPGARMYAMDVRQFEHQMRLVADSGCAMPARWTAMLRDARCLITFDDGHVSNHTLALPVLQRLNLRAIFFITTDWIDTPGFMTQAQLRELHGAGMLLGTHGCTHRYFGDLSELELRDELTRSRDRLLAIIGPVAADWPLTLALPGGRSHPALQSLAAELGYQFVFTSNIGFARLDSPHLNLPRIPITNNQPESLLPEILTGNSPTLKKMARNAELRAKAKSMLGNRLYDRLRGLIIRD